ncbi:MAG: Hsp20/alpha crystallin family protein [Oscillospiraceae bacterium]|nr:Hsp20/alpha crystallin family protein [Oscillospiraceae bacterium]
MFELSLNRPERNLMNMFDLFEREMFGPGRAPMKTFSTDLVDTGDAYRLDAELPGFNKDEIQVDLNGDLLTIKAEHNEEKEEKSDEKQGYVYRERRYGTFTRSFDVSGIDKAGITGKYENGVLSVTLPKMAKPEKEVRKIDLA